MRLQRVTYEVEYLPCEHKLMKPIYYLLYRGVKIPIMDIEDVEVVRFEKFEAVDDANAKILQIVTNIVGLCPNGGVATLCRVGIL